MKPGRFTPGTSLADIDPAAVRPGAVTSLFRGLADQHAPAVNMARIDGWLRRRLVDLSVVDFPIGQTTAPEHERHEALATLDSLVTTGDTGQLCHGDGYPGNVFWSVMAGCYGSTHGASAGRRPTTWPYGPPSL
jgi:Ser/Thr protein kinase RdoA (MazF antagonist)